MKTFMFIFLVGYAVRCDDSNYYVVEMRDNDVLPTKDFNVYWNVPTIQCKSRKIYFEDLYENYGIIQNTGDTFRGDKISILYDPGDFPALLRNDTSGEYKYRNGGVPQEGDLVMHLDTFQKVLNQSIPDTNFDGVGIIDFESWKPILRQNFGVLTPYKDVSYEIERQRHWWWKKQWIEEEAKRRFEEAAREFMQATVSLAKQMRPLALWGYYGFPYCFNMATNNKNESCADNVPEENDRTSWLWQESTALFPSVYSSNDLTSAQLAALIRGRVREAARVRGEGTPILPYFWYRYRDNGYFNETDLAVALNTFYKSNTSGFIIWGSSNDVNTLEKCQNLRSYVTDILGPAIAKYTKQTRRLEDDPDEETYNEILKSDKVSIYDPEYNWIPPANYTQKIEEMVDKELKEEAATVHTDIKESILVDMILNKIANYCTEGCDNNSKVTPTDENEGDDGINEPHVVLVTEDPFKKNPIGIEVSVPTTTEEDSYDYDTDITGDDPGDIYDANEYIVVSTTGKSIEQNSTNIKSIEEVSVTAAKDEAISILDINKEEKEIFNTNIEKSSTVDIGYEVSSTTIETNHAKQSNSTEESTTEISTTTSGHIEASIKEITTTESTTNSSPEGTVKFKNGLSLVEDEELDNNNNTGSNSIEVAFIDVSIEESSTINPTTDHSITVDTYSTIIDDTTEVSIDSVVVKPSTFNNNDTAVESKSAIVELSAVDNNTTVGSDSATIETNAIASDTRVGANIDSSATLTPVLTDQVLGSVSRAIVSKPLACSLFYIYSITKCICVLFGNC